MNTAVGNTKSMTVGTGDILSAAVFFFFFFFFFAYFCIIADNDFLNAPHSLIYSQILLMLISLYVPVG